MATNGPSTFVIVHAYQFDFHILPPSNANEWVWPTILNKLCYLTIYTTPKHEVPYFPVIKCMRLYLHRKKTYA